MKAKLIVASLSLLLSSLPALANTVVERDANLSGSGFVLQLQSNGEHHRGRLGFGGFFNDPAFVGALAMAVEIHQGPLLDAGKVLADDTQLGDEFQHSRLGLFIDIYQQQPELGRDRAGSGMLQFYGYNTRADELNNYGLGMNLGFGLSLVDALFFQLEGGLRPGVLSTAAFNQGLAYLGEYDWGLGLHYSLHPKFTLLADYNGSGIFHSQTPIQLHQGWSAGFRLLF